MSYQITEKNVEKLQQAYLTNLEGFCVKTKHFLNTWPNVLSERVVYLEENQGESFRKFYAYS